MSQPREPVSLRCAWGFLRRMLADHPDWYGTVTVEIEAGAVRRIVPARSILARDLTDDGEIVHTVASTK